MEKKFTKFCFLGIGLCSICLIAIACYKRALDREIHPGVLVHDVSIPSAQCIFDPKIFSQEYSFLGHGEQSCCFVSADGHYVLKFFLNNPLPNSKKYFKRLGFRLFTNFQSKHSRKIMRNYKILYENQPSLAGIVGIHLDTNRTDLPTVCLRNSQGNRFEIDLNHYPFILQKKATPLLKVLSECASEDQRRKILVQVHEFLKQKTTLGFVDNKRLLSLNRNYGFMENSLVQFDAGSLQFSQAILKSPSQEFSLVEQKFFSWIEKRGFFSAKEFEMYISNGNIPLESHQNF